MDAKKARETLERRNIVRKNVTLSLDQQLWKEFLKAIKNAKQNEMIEDLVRDYLELLNSKELASK